MSEHTDSLANHYLFAALDETQCRQVRSHSRTRHLARDEHLFVQGDPADAFWWLAAGQIKLYRLSRDGHQKVMGLVGPGQSFAEGILFMDSPRYPVNAQAVTSSVVYGFDRGAYLAVLENSFAACRGLFHEMVRRTQSHLDEIESLTIQNARFRLVHYLLRLRPPRSEGPSWKVRLPARKVLIASQLAVQPETLSRLFRELERDGFIRLHNDTVHVLEEAALQRLLL